eukprot:TRINITY_DN1765_c0_g1_i11.p1 TRINITY_DN1765_c0_g1~~TRINITY_DN1765_c0_g1_i11.p1  ORF type:complete len:136 (-),score=14.53 TRINITY_DN1765_c0_g1_i11:1-408(-)
MQSLKQGLCSVYNQNYNGSCDSAFVYVKQYEDQAIVSWDQISEAEDFFFLFSIFILCLRIYVQFLVGVLFFKRLRLVDCQQGFVGRCISQVRFMQRQLFMVAKKKKKKRSEEHTSELQSRIRISYAVFCLKKKNI